MKTRLPVHYQGHSATQGPKIDQITAGCTSVVKHDFFCRVDETIDWRHSNCISIMFSGTVLALVIVAFLVVAVLNKKCRGGSNNAAINEYSPLIGNDGQNDGN